MFSGILASTNDPKILEMYRQQGFRIIYIGDLDGETDFPITPDIIIGTAIAPDYNVLVQEMDGDQQSFEHEYQHLLLRPAAVELFCAIRAAMFRGINVVLYFPKDTEGMKFVPYLLNYIVAMYGIVVQRQEIINGQLQFIQFAYNPAYTNFNISEMYKLNLVSAQEFIFYGEELDGVIVNKLINDLHPYIGNLNTMEEIQQFMVQYATNYKNAMKAAQHELLTPVVYG